MTTLVEPIQKYVHLQNLETPHSQKVTHDESMISLFLVN